MISLRGPVLFAACSLFFLILPASLAAHPELKEGVFICSDGNPLNVGGFSAPTVVDWNSDGAKDLLVGQYNSGNIILFLNQGSNLNPVFSAGVQVESGGQPISVTYG